MKKILFATTNESKSKRFSKGLLENEIEAICFKDLNIDISITEDGTTAIENALIKARAGYELTKLPTIGMDDSLYLENVPEDKQPGLFVRRVNGKTLDDNEMINYYSSLVDIYGIDGKLNCKWVYGLAIINEKGIENTYTWEKDDFYMTNQISSIINKGYPLNSISKYKTFDKFFSELSDEEKLSFKQNEDHVVNFIVENM